MQCAIKKQTEVEQEKRAKIISAESEFLSAQKLAGTADITIDYTIALQSRDLQTLAEIVREKNSQKNQWASTVIPPLPIRFQTKPTNCFFADEQNYLLGRWELLSAQAKEQLLHYYAISNVFRHYILV